MGYAGILMPDPWIALFIVLQLIYLEGILSIDNAAVLGAMVAHLPPDEPVPWPRPLQVLQAPVHRLLGGQRLAALKVGLLGAYLGRGLMLFLASWVVRNRWLLLLGGLYLVKLGVDHLGETPRAVQREAAEAAGEPLPKVERSFWSVVLAVELADLAFSLDNVVAAVALSRDFWVVMTGVALGIVTMRFAAGVFVRLIERFPVLEAAAYLLVLTIGLGLLVEDLLHVRPNEVQRLLISLSIVVGAVVYERTPALQALGRRLRWLRRGIGFVGLLFISILKPLAWILRGIPVLARALVLVVAEQPRHEALREAEAAPRRPGSGRPALGSGNPEERMIGRSD